MYFFPTATFSITFAHAESAVAPCKLCSMLMHNVVRTFKLLSPLNYNITASQPWNLLSACLMCSQRQVCTCAEGRWYAAQVKASAWSSSELLGGWTQSSLVVPASCFSQLCCMEVLSNAPIVWWNALWKSGCPFGHFQSLARGTNGCLKQHHATIWHFLCYGFIGN